MNTKVATGSRILLGLIFFVFGLNGFLNFIPMPTNIPEPAMKMFGAFMETKYFFPFLKSTEVLSGAMLLSGMFVPLALLFLTPIALNIFLFHLFLEGPATLPLPVVILVLIGILARHHKDVFAPILKAK